MSSPSPSSQNKLNTDRLNAFADYCDESGLRENLKPKLKGCHVGSTDSEQNPRYQSPQTMSPPRAIELNNMTVETKTQAKGQYQVISPPNLSVSNESRRVDGWDRMADFNMTYASGVDGLNMSTLIKKEDQDGSILQQSEQDANNQSPGIFTPSPAFGVQLRAQGKKVVPIQDKEKPTGQNGKGNGRSIAMSIVSPMNQDLQLNPNNQRAVHHKLDSRQPFNTQKGRGGESYSQNRKQPPVGNLNYMKRQQVQQAENTNSSNREGGNRDSIFSLSKPMEQYANTLQLFDKPNFNIFNKKRMTLDHSQSSAKEIQQLLNNFKDEQIRMMQQQNVEFEQDKKQFLKKMQNAERGPGFLGGRRGSMEGVNPILRFLSDEKSILYKHLQTKEMQRPMSKEAYLGQIIKMGKKNLSQTPRREYLNSLKTNKNYKTEYHVKNFDFPETENPYFVPPAYIEQMIETNRSRKMSSTNNNSPLSNQILSRDYNQDIKNNQQLEKNACKQPTLMQLLQPPQLHEEIQNKLFKNKFAKINGKYGIERIMQQANKERHQIQKVITNDVHNLPNVLWELSQSRNENENVTTIQSSTITNTARDGTNIWSSRLRHNNSSQNDGIEEQKLNINVDLNSLQTFGNLHIDDAAGADLASVITPSLGKFIPNIQKQEQEQPQKRQQLEIQNKKSSLSTIKYKGQQSNRGRAETLDQEDKKRFRSSLGGWQVGKSSMDRQHSSRMQNNHPQDVCNFSGEGAPKNSLEMTLNPVKQMSNQNQMELVVQDSQNRNSEAFQLAGSTRQKLDYQYRAKKLQEMNEAASSYQQRPQDQIMTVHGVQSNLNTQVVKQKILLSKTRNSSRDGSKSSGRHEMKKKSSRLNEDITTARQVAVILNEPENKSYIQTDSNMIDQQLLVQTLDSTVNDQVPKQEPNSSVDGSFNQSTILMKPKSNDEIDPQQNTNNNQINLSQLHDTMSPREDYPMEALDQGLSKTSLNSKKTPMTPISTKIAMNSNDTNQTFSPIHSVRVNKDSNYVNGQQNDNQIKSIINDTEDKMVNLYPIKASQIGGATITSTKKKSQYSETKPSDHCIQHWQNVKNVHIVFNPSTLAPSLQNSIAIQQIAEESNESRENMTVRTRGDFNKHVRFHARRPTAPMMARRFISNQHAFNHNRRKQRNHSKMQTYIPQQQPKKILDYYNENIERKEFVMNNITSDANEDSIVIETPYRNKEWNVVRNSQELNDGPRTDRGGSWSAKRAEGDSNHSSMDNLGPMSNQTPDRKKAVISNIKTRQKHVELSINCLSIEGRGQQDAISAFRELKRQQNDKLQAKKIKDPSTPQNPRLLAAPTAIKQVQLSVKMDQALSKENSSVNQELQNDQKILIKDEDRRTTMKMSETHERKGETVQNSSRASREGIDESIFKNSRTDKNNISEISKENTKTKSIQDGGRNGNIDAPTSRHLYHENERNSSMTYQNNDPNRSIMYSGFDKSSIRDIENNLIHTEKQQVSDNKDKSNDLRPSSRQQDSLNGISRQQPIDNPTLISNSIYYKQAPETSRSKSRRHGHNVVTGVSSKRSMKSKNQDLDLKEKDGIIKSEQFQVKVIKYPNTIKLMSLNHKQPPKTAGDDRPRRTHHSPRAHSIPRRPKGVQDQFQNSQKLDSSFNGGRGNKSLPKRIYPMSHIGGQPVPIPEKQRPLPLPQQALILYQRNQKQKLQNLKLNANGLLMQQNEKMLLRPSTHLKKQNELKRVLETLSKRKALVLDEQKIFQLLINEQESEKRMQTIEVHAPQSREKARSLFLQGENVKNRRNELAEIIEIGAKETKPHKFSLITPQEKPRTPQKNSTVEFLGLKMKKQGGGGGMILHEPGSALRSNELELRILSDGDAFDVQAPMNALSDSGELLNPNEDIRISNFEDPESNVDRLNVLKHHTQKILQKNLNQNNYYQYQKEI